MITALNKTNLVRVQLTARAWSRMCGGYGFWGHYKLMLYGSMLASIIWTFLFALPRLFQIDFESGCVSLECVLTESDIQALVNMIFLLAAVVFPTELFVKPWARSMKATDELRAVARMGVPEAAFALAEIHADNGANAQEDIWMAEAVRLGHPIAIKQMKRNLS